MSDLLADDSTNDNNPALSDLAIYSEAAAAFASLPTVIQEALTQKKRIVCIANNPSVDTTSLDALLQPTDMLVLFNHFIHADYFANHPLISKLPKLLFFRQIGDSNLHFGLPPRNNNVTAINEMSKQAPLGILLSNQPYQFPRPSEDASAHHDPVTASRVLALPDTLNDLLHDDNHCRVLSEHHPVVGDYPHFADIHSSAPSSGFLLYRLLLAARVHVQHLQESAMPLQVLMIGFNDEDKTAHFWPGHNWTFERQEMAKAPYGVQIIRQY
ncbi:hypothetical protein ES754_05825 [Psychrobacter frigidicola]|uniref:Uncharacterized protein n=1 Tax=Psychrobacter frigidicola TaxID=45611 RepID=A0A5C7A4V1_9GAMM|nr:hypothetical protein [Psychrobacter frigidicola]TXD98431.1 hypothetical protein ES754_05825 [Psychrobacter frigidicola]